MNQAVLKQKPRIAIVGTGAIGGYYGGKLAKQNDVHFFARSDVEYIRQNGLRIDSVDGDFSLPSVNTSTLEENVGTFDLVIVALKTTQNSTVVKQLSPLLHPNSVILIIQNGLNVEAVFHDQFPSHVIVGGLAFVCANKNGPGWIEHQDYGFIKLGNFHQATDEVLKTLCGLFEASGITCTIIDHLQLARWEKLVWNIPFAGLSIQNNCTTQALLTSPTHRAQLKALMLEVISIAQTDGCALPNSLADNMLTYTDKMVDYAPSTLLDFRAGQPIELEAIFQEPLKVAQSYNLNTPCLSELVESLKSMDDQRKYA